MFGVMQGLSGLHRLGRQDKPAEKPLDLFFAVLAGQLVVDIPPGRIHKVVVTTHTAD